jgi:altronate dehydratase small subunit
MSTWKWFVKFPGDNVVTLTKDAPANTFFIVDSDEISILRDTPFGHKIAIKNIEGGGDIIKYGVKIGVATTDILKGEHVHIHNVDEVSLMIRDEEKKRSLRRS